jgi:hypothetical protein
MSKPVKESEALKALRKSVLAQYLEEKRCLIPLADQFETVALKEKSVIFQQGEPNDSLYFVLDGSGECCVAIRVGSGG